MRHNLERGRRMWDENELHYIVTEQGRFAQKPRTVAMLRLFDFGKLVYQAACREYPNSRVILRHGARVLEQSGG